MDSWPQIVGIKTRVKKKKKKKNRNIYFFNSYSELFASFMSFDSVSEDLPKVHMTCMYQEQEKPPSLIHTVTFLSKNTFVGLPTLKAYSKMEVYFRFKTKHTSGLFFYNGGKHNDFVLAELINGHLLINIRLGTHVIRLRDSSKNSYNDNYWHTVHLLQISATMFCLLVDDLVSSTATISRPHNIQLNGMFYVGEYYHYSSFSAIVMYIILCVTYLPFKLKSIMLSPSLWKNNPVSRQKKWKQFFYH